MDASASITKAEAAAVAWRAASTLGQPSSADGMSAFGISASKGAWYSDLTVLFPLGGASVGLVVLGAWCAASGDGPRRRNRMKKGRTLVSQVDEDDLLEMKKLTKEKKSSTAKKKGTTKKKKERARSSSFMGFPRETA